MALPGFLKSLISWRSPRGESDEASGSRRPAARGRGAAGSALGALSAAPPPEVVRARTLARRRLMGSAVLLAVGVVAFPLLFDHKPRPVSVDLPIEVASRKAGPEAAAAGAKAEAGLSRDIAGPTAGSTASGVKPVTPLPAAAGAAPSASAPAPAAELPAPSEPVVAAAAPASAPAAAAAPVAGSNSAQASGAAERFVVQVGAFTDAGAVREARQKVEKLGLKTYTQVVDTEGGKRTRVRVGPFATRDEAARAQARLKEAGLPGNLLAL